jgi:hypothetical protein
MAKIAGKRMKIAFVVSFFDFRNDVRRVIAEVARQHEVVVLGRAEQAESIQAHLPEGIEFRLISERQGTLRNRVWEKLYLLFRKIPRSRANFFLMELFKASNQPDTRKRAKARRLVQWMRFLPKLLPYDTYLNQLGYLGQTHLDDIDRFICFTAIADDYLLARLIQEKKSVLVYVYSWDHPCKHTCFSSRVRYACWSEPIREDIISLQNIPADQVTVTGASQFGYIEVYRRTKVPPRSYPFRYVYFGCAIGIPALVPDEIRLIKILADALGMAQPDWKLLLRPYPVLTNWAFYEELRQLPNVVFDEDFRTGDLSVQEDAILKKYATIEQAEAFFHLGTTMGLEAGFTQTPSFILDFGYSAQEGLSLYNFIHQYQNDRHLINLAPQNAIRSEEMLRQLLTDLANPTFTELNQHIQEGYSLKSFADFTRNLILHA